MMAGYIISFNLDHLLFCWKMKTNQFGKQGWTPERNTSIEGKTFVVIGTTSGTGFEAAKILLSKDSYPELMCATEQDLDQKEFCGPTGRSNWVGPVGSHDIKPFAKDKEMAKRLWDLSEELTGIAWTI